jgi:hypothetical protein
VPALADHEDVQELEHPRVEILGQGEEAGLVSGVDPPAQPVRVGDECDAAWASPRGERVRPASTFEVLVAARATFRASWASLVVFSCSATRLQHAGATADAGHELLTET